MPDLTAELRRSFAVLGLAPSAPLPEVRRRYRILARRWHPDRYASDPSNQSEAAANMQRINDAYRVIVEGAANPVSQSDRQPKASRRLSPEEIDALAKAIGSDGPVDWLLGSIGWMGSTIEGVLSLVFGALLAVRIVRAVLDRDLSVFREHPELILGVALLAVLAGREYWVRSRLERAARGSDVS